MAGMATFFIPNTLQLYIYSNTFNEPIKRPGINKMKDDYWMTETDYPITIIASIFQPFVGA